MRVFVVSAVVLVSVFGVACSSTSNEQGSSSQETSEAEKSADSEDTKVENTQPLQDSVPSEQEFRLGETATFLYGDTTTVYSYVSPDQSANEFIQPKAGNQFAVIDVEICAGSGEGIGPSGNTQLSINPFQFSLQIPDSTPIEPTLLASPEPALPAANLSAGECVRGNLGFEVPQSQTPTFVHQEGTPSAKWAIE
jgi:Domain of unknown function (DUF4352)